MSKWSSADGWQVATPLQAKPTLFRIPAETFSRSLLVMLVMLMMLILILLILGGLIMIVVADVGDALQFRSDLRDKNDERSPTFKR